MSLKGVNVSVAHTTGCSLMQYVINTTAYPITTRVSGDGLTMDLLTDQLVTNIMDQVTGRTNDRPGQQQSLHHHHQTHRGSPMVSRKTLHTSPFSQEIT